MTFLKRTQVQTRNPLQRRSDVIWSETPSANMYNVQRGVQGSGVSGEKERSTHTPLSSKFRSTLSAENHATTHFATQHSRVSRVYRDSSREDLQENSSFKYCFPELATPVNLEENKMPKLSPIPRFYDCIYISLATVDVRK